MRLIGAGFIGRADGLQKLLAVVAELGRSLPCNRITLTRRWLDHRD